ncbi:hypothetical protein B6U80_01515 [Candidatus Pacearchaeota archaeon ex4484_26]|nr:MAG: hypothetical protein B6U80_01515 [Candidatus Pacearchaeota archaeon ex4484_26]
MKNKPGLRVFNLVAILAAFILMVVLIANQPMVHVLAESNNTNDTTPPTTESTFTSEEWQNSDILIELPCEDDVECDKTYYCIDQAGTCEPTTEYSTTILHSTEGISYIRFFSSDTSGNSEETKSQILKLDKGKPSVTITVPTQNQQVTGTSFIIQGTSEDSVSGINKIEVLVNDNKVNAIGKENWQYEWKDFTDGSYTIVVNAIDNAGNVGNKSVDITVNNPPSAKIVSINDPPLIKAGRIEVDLQTSEPVQFYPSLSYSFGAEDVQIPLEGSSQEWRGFMIITENDHDKIGTFKFSGIDFDGNVGNTITQGNYFVVDAVKPEEVVSVSTEVDGDDVKIKWFYEGEELKEFRVYRSTEKDVDYTNYYKTVPVDATSTSDDLGGKTYYYKVAAVDLAGNVGPLSEEVSATPKETTGETSATSTQPATPAQPATPTPTLPIQVLAKIDSAIENINSEITEIEKARLILEKESVSEELGLILQLNKAKASFNGFKQELEGFKTSGLSKSDIENKVQQINLKVMALMNDLPKEITLESEGSFIQEIFFRDIKNVANLITHDLTSRERDSYIIQNQRLQNRVEVKVVTKFYKITLFEGEKDTTLIRKEISSALKNIPNASVVEVVPKTMASSVDKVHFITQGYEVLQEDPIVRWNKDIYEIKYYVDKKVPQEDLLQAKTLVLSKSISSYNPFTSLAVGGKAIVSTIADTKILFGLVMLVILIVVYFVYLRNISIPISFGGLRKTKYNKYKEYKPGHYSQEFYKRYNQLSQRQNQNTFYSGGQTRMINEYTQPLTAPQKRQMQNLALMPKQDFMEHFNEIAEKAHSYLDNGNFTLATKSYSLLLDLYKRISDKKTAYNEIIKIYNKLNLYSKIKELNALRKVNPNMNLRNLLEHISELYSVVAEAEKKDTKLLRFAREYYDYAISKFRS